MLSANSSFVVSLLAFSLLAGVVGGLFYLVAIFERSRARFHVRRAVLAFLALLWMGIVVSIITGQSLMTQLVACSLVIAAVLCIPWRCSPVQLFLARRANQRNL